MDRKRRNQAAGDVTVGALLVVAVTVCAGLLGQHVWLDFAGSRTVTLVAAGASIGLAAAAAHQVVVGRLCGSCRWPSVAFATLYVLVACAAALTAAAVAAPPVPVSPAPLLPV